MTLTDTIAACKAELLAQAPRIVETQAQTALALVTLRIQSQGLGVPYSTKDAPLFWFKDRELNGQGKAWYEQKEKRTKPERKTDPATWEGFKKVQGYGSSSVNLTYTGRMFRSLTTIFAGFSGLIYTARIVASDEEEAKKVQYNMARYGDFLQPQGAEVAQVAEVGQVALVRIINQYFPQA